MICHIMNQAGTHRTPSSRSSSVVAHASTVDETAGGAVPSHRDPKTPKKEKRHYLPSRESRYPRRINRTQQALVTKINHEMTHQDPFTRCLGDAVACVILGHLRSQRHRRGMVAQTKEKSQSLGFYLSFAHRTRPITSVRSLPCCHQLEQQNLTSCLQVGQEHTIGIRVNTIHV